MSLVELYNLVCKHQKVKLKQIIKIKKQTQNNFIMKNVYIVGVNISYK